MNLRIKQTNTVIYRDVQQSQLLKSLTGIYTYTNTAHIKSAEMIEVTSFLLKHLYELMADHDQNDLDSLMVIMAQNQIPNLICDTIVELLFIFVSMALIIVMVGLSEFYSDESSCRFFIGFGCPRKTIQASY